MATDSMREAPARAASPQRSSPGHPLSQHLERLLGALPPAAQGMSLAAHPRAVQKGEALLREGERWQHLWWVERGAFRLYYLDRNGQAANKNFYLDGAMFWPITPELAGEPVRFWVEAMEPSVVWALPWAEWKAACEHHAPWHALERHVLSRLFQDKMEREQQFLQLSASERYQALLRQRPDWLSRIPLRQLASYLGVTDVALSRIRRRLSAN